MINDLNVIRASFECDVRETMKQFYSPELLEWNSRAEQYKDYTVQQAYIWYKKGYLNGERS